MTQPAHLLEVDGLRVILARSFWRRFVGLLGRKGMDADEALLLAPCRDIHTFFMRFAIDVVFLDAEGRVVAIVSGLKPWRLAASRNARACLELASGGAGRHRLKVGRCIPSLSAVQWRTP